MSCKKLINAPSRCVDDAIEGLVLVNNNLTTICNGRVVIRRDVESIKKAGKVTLIGGGGSGHEPAWPGYVGPGMITAAVCGNIFASPPSSTVYEAIMQCASEAGVLVIVKNYTGDRVNFGLAIERAHLVGVKCALIVAAEDCALASGDRSAGRRGLCGALFMYKIAGAMADRGASLDEIARYCENINANMGTMGVSLGSCSLPGASEPLFNLAQDQIELGLGIHGEAGVKMTKLMTAAETVAAMLDHMTNSESCTKIEIQAGDRIAIIVNNLGGTSNLEMGVVSREAILLLQSRGLVVERTFCGSFVTSLEMPGISITVLKVNDIVLKYLDAETEVPAWIKPWRSDIPATFVPTQQHSLQTAANAGSANISSDSSQILKKVITAACEALISAEQKLDDLDKGCGDGDTGFTIKLGAQAILEYVKDVDESVMLRPARLLTELSTLVEKQMGGTSGGLYSLLLSAAAAEFVQAADLQQLIVAFEKGLQAIMKYGRGQLGDRTMLDALIPAQKCLAENINNLDLKATLLKMAEVARRGADSTAGMRAKAGRASYTPVSHQSNNDPGAEAAAIWLTAIADAFK